MTDSLGRKITYLRLSVTERCRLSCPYCAGNVKLRKEDELRPEEFSALAEAFAALGGKKIRLTGGEPLEREDLCEIIQRIAEIGAYEDIAITTNGQGLDASRLCGLVRAGLTRVNISLDSLKPDVYRRLTGGGLQKVLAAMEGALSAGLPLKINTVVMPGVNDGEVDDFIGLARDNCLDVRFIELMPFNGFGETNGGKMLNDALIKARPWLRPVPSPPSDPARLYTVEGYKGKIGFINAVSNKFCANCNRARITADGKLRACLGDNAETPLLPALRQGREELINAMRGAIYKKPAGHGFFGGFASSRDMNRIGG